MSTQVRVERSGVRVVGVVGALEAGSGRVLLWIVSVCCGHNLDEADLAELTDGPCGWLAASAMAEVLAMI